MLLRACQRGPAVRASRRALVVLLLAAGRSWREIKAVAFVSFDLIRSCVAHWKRGGVDALLPPPEAPTSVPSWLGHIVLWLSQRTPQDFGFYRTRWSCSALAETLLGRRAFASAVRGSSRARPMRLGMATSPADCRPDRSGA